VQDATSVMSEQEENVQDPVANSRHCLASD
jgi:hypothetical protein